MTPPINKYIKKQAERSRVSVWEKALELLIAQLVHLHDVIQVVIILLHVPHEVRKTSVLQLSKWTKPLHILEGNLSQGSQQAEVNGVPVTQDAYDAI